MVDWLVVWGVAQAAGLVFKPILEELARDATKDYAKDFFKGCLKKVIHLPEKDVQKEAYGKALTRFLQLMEEELLNAGYEKPQIQYFVEPVDNLWRRRMWRRRWGGRLSRTVDRSILRCWQELGN
jgi:hypothetical protein